MVAPTKRRSRRKRPPSWHRPFLAMLPKIRRQARVAFWHLNPEAREEAVDGVICNACSAMARLDRRGTRVERVGFAWERGKVVEVA